MPLPLCCTSFFGRNPGGTTEGGVKKNCLENRPNFSSQKKNPQRGGTGGVQQECHRRVYISYGANEPMQSARLISIGRLAKYSKSNHAFF